MGRVCLADMLREDAQLHEDAHWRGLVIFGILGIFGGWITCIMWTTFVSCGAACRFTGDR
ncbi:MAG: hypothetical protein ACR2M0_13070 [Chloroflexia bacterium]